MWYLLIIHRMRTWISKYLLLLLVVLLPLGASAQLHDQLTSPQITKDLPKLTLRLTQLAAGEIAVTEAQIFETSSIAEWAIYSDSLNQGLRSLAGYEEAEGENSQQTDSLSWDLSGGDETSSEQKHTNKRVRKTALEWYWLAHGLISEISDLVRLYLDFVDRMEDKDYAFGALQDETVAVFYEEGKNALHIFQNTYEMIKQDTMEVRTMSAQQCFTLGKQLSNETNRINRRLKYQMLRVQRFDRTKVPNQVLNDIGKRLTEGQHQQGTKSTFDPAEFNKQW